MTTALSTLAMVSLVSLGQIPVGLPPQPEVTAITLAAPEECFVYLASAGMGTPDAQSDNLTEQFLAEPDVQAFCDHATRLLNALAEDLLGSLDEQGLPGTEDGELPSDETLKALLAPFGRQLLTRPWMAYVRSLGTWGDGEDFASGIAATKGAIVVQCDEPEVTQRQIHLCLSVARQVLTRTLPEGAQVDDLLEERESCEGQGTIYSIAIPSEVDDARKLVLGVGRQGDLIVIAIGEGELDAVFGGMETPAPKWLQEMKQAVGIERTSTIMHICLEEILAKLTHAGLLDMIDDDLRELLVVDSLKSLTWASGLDGDGYVTRIQVGMKDGPQGIWKDVLSGRIETSDMAIVPSDSLATLAVALPDNWIEFDEEGNLLFFGHSINGDEDAEDDASPSGLSLMDKLVRQTGADLVGSFGDSWVLYLSQSENGLIPYNVTLANRLDDVEHFEQSIGKLVAGLVGQRLLNDTEVQVQSNGVSGTVLRTMYFGDDFPVGLSWIVVDGTLYASVNSMALKSIIYRDENFESLATDQRLNDVLGEHGLTAALVRTDPLLLFDMAYGALAYATRFIESAIYENEDLARTRAVGFSAAIWPATTVVRKYATPTTCCVQATPYGFHIESRKTIPCNIVEGYVGLSVLMGGMAMVSQMTPAYTPAGEATPDASPLTVPHRSPQGAAAGNPYGTPSVGALGANSYPAKNGYSSGPVAYPMNGTPGDASPSAYAAPAAAYGASTPSGYAAEQTSPSTGAYSPGPSGYRPPATQAYPSMENGKVGPRPQPPAPTPSYQAMPAPPEGYRYLLVPKEGYSITLTPSSGRTTPPHPAMPAPLGGNLPAPHRSGAYYQSVPVPSGTYYQSAPTMHAPRDAKPENAGDDEQAERDNADEVAPGKQDADDY